MKEQINWARTERHELADLLTKVGPSAATLCAGWTTQDLAAHIVMRDRRPDAGAGLVIPALHNYSERVRRGLLQLPWAELLHQVRTGPPNWNPMAWSAIDKSANLFEFFVHHEDVLRAGEAWQPRTISAPLAELIMSRLRNSAWLMWRRARVGVILTDGQTSIVAKRPPMSTGIVTVTGEPSELLMLTFGRKQALVKVSGAEKDLEVFHQTNLSV